MASIPSTMPPDSTLRSRAPKAITQASPSSTVAIPSPFTPAPENLSPFLATLSRTSVYITHIDTLPYPHKRLIFLTALTLNLTLAALLLLRAYLILPFYFQVLLHLLGHTNTGTTIDPSSSTWGHLFWFSVRRCGTLALDAALVLVVSKWPWTFFAEGPANPCSWRWRVGFREREIVVRESRGWGTRDLLGAASVTSASPKNTGGKGKGAAKDGGDAGEAGDASRSPFFKVRVLPAIQREYVRDKTGYLMMGADWDLEFAAMIAAHGMVDREEVELEAFEKAVWVWVGSGRTADGRDVKGRGRANDLRGGKRGGNGGGGGGGGGGNDDDGEEDENDDDEDEEGIWCVWPVWKLDEGVDVARRKKIVEFKDRLTTMGKESLFFRWVELIQQFASPQQPGGFTPERQAEAVARAREMFEAEGVDFEKLVRDMGGVEGMPGF